MKSAEIYRRILKNKAKFTTIDGIGRSRRSLASDAEKLGIPVSEFQQRMAELLREAFSEEMVEFEKPFSKEKEEDNE